MRFLIRAFARFAERERDSRLVLVGETFAMRSLPEVAEVLREADRLRVADRVVTMGYVDDDRLRELYGHSLTLASIFAEGEGLTFWWTG